MNGHDRADPTFGIGSQARAILHFLTDAEPSFATYEDGYYDIRIETFPWYNGREKGICLVVQPRYTGTPRALHITFGEDRRTDSIFVDTWEDTTPFNCPTLEGADQEAYDKAYQNRKHFNQGRVGDAAEYIIEAMEGYYKANHAKVEKPAKAAKRGSK